MSSQKNSLGLTENHPETEHSNPVGGLDYPVTDSVVGAVEAKEEQEDDTQNKYHNSIILDKLLDNYYNEMKIKNIDESIKYVITTKNVNLLKKLRNYYVPSINYESLIDGTKNVNLLKKLRNYYVPSINYESLIYYEKPITKYESLIYYEKPTIKYSEKYLTK